MITVRPDGSIVTDDIGLALRLSKRMTKNRKDQPLVEESRKPLEWNDFVARLGERPRRLLHELRTAGELTTAQLRERLGYDKAQSVTGLLAILNRAMNFAQLPRDDVYRREERTIDGAPVAIYVCGPKLKESGPLV